MLDPFHPAGLVVVVGGVEAERAAVGGAADGAELIGGVVGEFDRLLGDAVGQILVIDDLGRASAAVAEIGRAADVGVVDELGRGVLRVEPLHQSFDYLAQFAEALGLPITEEIIVE